MDVVSHNPQDPAAAPIGTGQIADTLLASVAWLCRHHGRPRSVEALLAGLPRGRMLSPSLALRALENAGLAAGAVERPLGRLPVALAPFALLRKDGGGAIFLDRCGDADNVRYRVILPELGDTPTELPAAELEALYAGVALLAKPVAGEDRRAGEPAPKAGTGHWLLTTLWRYRRYYRGAVVATVLVNVLALAGVFFTMNVYDRVIPNQAYVTLWSLAVGVILAIAFEALTRQVRTRLLDVAGKKADLVLGSLLFRQAMAVRMEHRPASPGAFAHQLREFEAVRDFAASATLASLADIPFVLLFLGVIFFIGGTLGWIPLMLVPLIIAVSIAIQWPLASTMKENLRESSLKQGLLIEAMDGLESLKAAGGEGAMQSRWEHFCALSANTSIKLRHLSSLAMTAFTSLQQLQTVLLVIAGVYLIGAGELTMGALIGTVMLAGRATAPLGQVVGLAVRFQQARVALHSLNKLMDTPRERDVARGYLAAPSLRPQLTLRKLGFAYPQSGMLPNPPVLQNIELTLQPGERVALLGRVGSGKSTLLKLMARLYAPTRGQMLTDGIDVEQIDPADWRALVGYVGQDARLFHGTLRENVTLGRPEATADELLRVLKVTGLDRVAAAHPMGVNMPLGENGQGLSGGQKQLAALARALLLRPRLLLLDEPTSAMDTQSEAAFLERLAQATTGSSLVVVTHRPALLELVDRVVVVEEGRVAMDGPKDAVLARLQGRSGKDRQKESVSCG